MTSVDLSEVGLSKARDLAKKRGVAIQTVQANLEDHGIDTESHDLIVSIYCHLPDAIGRWVHARAEVALRSGGLFILEAFHHPQLKYQSGGPKTSTLLYKLGHYLITIKCYRYCKHFMIYASTTRVLDTQDSAIS
mgnify:CR=1 FL=1